MSQKLIEVKTDQALIDSNAREEIEPAPLTTGLSQLSFSQASWRDLSQSTVEMIARETFMDEHSNGDISTYGGSNSSALLREGANPGQVSPAEAMAITESYGAITPDVLIVPTQYPISNYYSGIQPLGILNSIMPYPSLTPCPVLPNQLVRDTNTITVIQNMVGQTPSPVFSMGTRPMDSPSPELGISFPVAPVQSSSSVKIDVPISEPFGGVHGFGILFPKAPESEAKKTISYVLAEELNMLFVKNKTWCPIRFLCRSDSPPRGTTIRAMAVYSKPQYAAEAVKRCLKHVAEDSGSKRDHFVQAQHKKAHYMEDSINGRQSVSVPWESQVPETNWIELPYQFMCLNSCLGTGPSRGPLRVIFTLEHNGTILGRQYVDLRVCACPGRDKEALKCKDKAGRRGSSPSTSGSATKKACTRGLVGHGAAVQQRGPTATRGGNADGAIFVDDNDDNMYYLPIRGRKMFEFVSNFYKMCESRRVGNTAARENTLTGNATTASCRGEEEETVDLSF